MSIYFEPDVANVESQPQPKLLSVVCMIGLNDGSVASACKVRKDDWMCIEAIHALPDAPQTSDVLDLATWLIKSGHTFTSSQEEELIARFRGIDDEGLFNCNLFLIETGDPMNPVSVSRAIYSNSGCLIRDVDAFGIAYHWNANNRLFVRNLDVSRLYP